MNTVRPDFSEVVNFKVFDYKLVQNILKSLTCFKSNAYLTI